ncbi:putative glucan endo-1,6-beta-glucosidase B [Trichoderma lentiforme]|uniref:glucan endo-1,6-beta-glucosidase n=1 Tax=Trichoderma lentiforme TaxID=1567552 RepID=A0A9P5C8D1_9HYPO|nr:putative glucan endo-1,6-beta-glucosidase B [Trichoderma lentiforme]
MKYSIVAPAILAGTAFAWLPQDRDLKAFNQTARFEQLGKRFEPALASGITKIRGVNFGGWLISEPWMMSNEWNNNMGCNGAASEFDCMRNNYMGSKRATGNTKFQNHYRDWINPATVQSVHDVGLNTIRIPIGYWSYNAIVDTASEPFADGNLQLPYLDAVVQKAADLGIYVIIDLHGAPGGQQQDAFTGQNPNPAGFYNSYDYGRAEKWLSWMTNRIHTNPAYSTVGMIEVLNEPVSRHDGGGRYPAPGQDPSMVQTYYPGALKAVRDAEAALNVPSNKKLHVQFMSSKWDSGDPRSNAAVKNDPMVGFDDHNYIGFALQNTGDQYSLMHSACTDSRVVNGQDFAITGEWSMTSGADWHDGNFFTKFFTAQQQLYESPGMDGWIYWTWKTELNDPRWTYSYATYLNYIPTNAAALQQNVYQDVCAGFR